MCATQSRLTVIAHATLYKKTKEKEKKKNVRTPVARAPDKPGLVILVGFLSQSVHVRVRGSMSLALWPALFLLLRLSAKLTSPQLHPLAPSPPPSASTPFFSFLLLRIYIRPRRVKIMRDVLVLVIQINMCYLGLLIFHLFGGLALYCAMIGTFTPA